MPLSKNPKANLKGGRVEGGCLGIPDPQVLDASSIRVLILNSFNDKIAHHYLTRTWSV